MKAMFLAVVALGTTLTWSEKAYAEPYPITWEDLERIGPSCYRTCDPVWTTCTTCEFDSSGYSYCDQSPCPQCSGPYHDVCTQVRIPLSGGDLITVVIERGAVDPSGIEFKLVAKHDAGKWRQITIIGGGDAWRVWTEGGMAWCNWPQQATPNCDTIGQWSSIVRSEDSRILFSKTMYFWQDRVDVYALGNLAQRLQPGDRVTFTW